MARQPIRRSRGHDDAVRITSAPHNPADDLAARQRRYVISMSIRTGCFVGACTVAIAGGPAWVMWTLVLGALVLPYVAVVMANSATPRIDGPGPTDPGTVHPELRHGPSSRG